MMADSILKVRDCPSSYRDWVPPLASASERHVGRMAETALGQAVRNTMRLVIDRVRPAYTAFSLKATISGLPWATRVVG